MKASGKVIVIVICAAIIGTAAWWFTREKPGPSFEVGENVGKIRIEIKMEAVGEIIKYQEESFYSENDFAAILENEDEFKSQLIKNFKEEITGVTAKNCDVSLDQSRKSVVLKCDIEGAMYGTDSYNMHFLLKGTERFGFDLYGFEPRNPPYGNKLAFEGEINGIPTKIIFEFPYELSHCHEHVWPA